MRKAFRRQVILQSADPSGGLEELAQDELTNDLIKRQMIINPQLQQLQALTNQQQLQVTNQQPVLRTLVAQQPFQFQQPIVQQPALSGFPQSLTFNPLQSPFRFLTSNYVSPVQTSDTARASDTRLVSPQPAGLATSPLASRMMVNGFGNDHTSLGMLGLSQLTGSQEMPGMAYRAYSPYHRKPYRRPLYRRRLHRPEEYDEDEDALPEEDGPIGEETASQTGSYSEEVIPGPEGQTLLDSSHVGFGPITVEAKTAQGERLALNEGRRNYVQRPKDAKQPK